MKVTKAGWAERWGKFCWGREGVVWPGDGCGGILW